jgi:CheY-like chemotaxis protein/anti-sigma regulatory factor (Ser/Thr protein kinase)
VFGDLARLVQVLSNLLNNAAKYMHPNGRIQLKASLSGPWVEFCVKDEGIGIAPEALPKLFSLFSRIANSDDLTQGGLGIGLALVRQLVELHGGTVDVTSEGLNKGCTFTVRLPLSQALPDVAATDAVQLPAPKAAAARKQVLIADDNLDARDTLATLFELEGYEVRKAADGQEALDEAEGWRPRCILLDLGMPIMDGYEVARRIRAQPWARDSILIAISGRSQPRDREHAFSSGFDKHFAKPVDFDSLVQALTGTPDATS